MLTTLPPLRPANFNSSMTEITFPGESNKAFNTIITRARFGPGQVSYIDNREGVHKIKNNGAELAVSLHVYSPACEIPSKSNGHAESLGINPG